MSWIPVNKWEQIEVNEQMPRPQAERVERDDDQLPDLETKQIFKENINLLVKAFGSRTAFCDAAGIGSGILTHWLEKGVSSVTDKSRKAFVRLGVVHPEDLFTRVLSKHEAETIAADAITEIDDGPEEPKPSDLHMRFDAILKSPYRIALEMAVDLIFNRISESEQHR